MIRPTVILFLFLLSSPLGFSQVVDSLTSALQEVKSNRARLYTLINLAKAESETDAQRAMKHVGEALELAYTESDATAEGYCASIIGSINYEAKRYNVAMEYYGKAVRLLEKQGEGGSQWTYTSYKYLARSYDALEDYDEALKHYHLFLALAEARGNELDVTETQEAIGRVYFNQENYAEAEVWYQKAQGFYIANGFNAPLIDVNDALGDIQLAQNMDTAAENYYVQSQNLAEEIGDRGRAGKSISKLGDVYGNRKEPDRQIEYEQQALTYNTEWGNEAAANTNYLNIGKIYLENDNTTEAIPWLHNSINMSEELGLLETKEEALKILGDAYQKVGDFDKAQESYDQLAVLRDSARKRELNENLVAAELTADLARSEERIALLEQQRIQQVQLFEKETEAREANLQRQQIISYSLAGGLVVLSFSAFFVYRSSRQKRRANQLLALQSLRSQMNPHFIFNSLNSVNSFIARNDERSANKYLSEFSRLMRAVMENSKHDFVPLTSELDILRLYLGLEHVRFEDKFDYTFNVDANMDSDAIEIPPMLIQPYIENAIWHGLRYRPEKGALTVNFKTGKDHLLVIIEDNGIGREKSQEIKTKNQRSNQSTGMRNIRQRLEIINEIHGTKLNVNIADSKPGEEYVGTRVEIAVPHQTTAADI